MPTLPVDIFESFADIMATLNTFSLIFCAFLIYKGKKVNQQKPDFYYRYQLITKYACLFCLKRLRLGRFLAIPG